MTETNSSERKMSLAIKYFFTSTKADGGEYSRTIPVDTKDRQGALRVAKIVGFHEFGERFTENCFDWEVIKS